MEHSRLARAGIPVDTEPQVVRLLAHLLENRDRLVSKDELIDAVWNGRIVSDATLNSRINSARRAVEDDGKTQWAIRTYSKQGYQFIADVYLEGEADDLGDRPSIVVLPFENLGGPQSEDYSANGLTDDVITGLSAFHSIRVTARNSAFAFSKRNVSADEIARDLAVQYIVTGSIRKTGSRVRINVRLADVRSDTEIWTQRYDRQFEDVFEVL